MLLQFIKNLFDGGGNVHLEAALAQKPLLLDVRSQSEFATGSVAGAVNIPLQNLPGRLKEIRGQKHIVVFCRSGNRSGMAKTVLDKNGFANVTNGGSWQNVNQIFNNKK